MLRQFPKDSEVRKGFEAAISASRGPGEGAPVKILTPPTTLDRAVKTAARRPRGRPHRRADPDQGQAPHPHHRHAAPRRRRAGLQGADPAPAARAAAPARWSAATRAAQVDFNHAITGSLWKIAAWVLIATFVLLLVMLRSVALALQAVVANVLSVAASYGVLTAVFVWGWPDGLRASTRQVIWIRSRSRSSWRSSSASRWTTRCSC